MGSTFLTIFVAVILMASIGFCFLSVKRLYDYIQAHRFERSHYTLLLGFIHLRMIVGAYILTTLLTAGFFLGIFIYFSA